MTATAYWSIALDDMARPDYGDMMFAVLPEGTTTDPSVWADTIFSTRSAPWWVGFFLGLRQLLVPLLGIPLAPKDIFAIRRVEGTEVLLSANDVHLDFRCGIAVDPVAKLVRVTTAVRLKGWRGHLYFWSVRLGHPVIVHAMIRGAQRTLSRQVGTSRNR